MKIHIMMKPTATTLTLAAWFLFAQPGQCFYNPSTGKWISRDPAAEAQGGNLYGFTANDALNQTDLLGLEIVCRCPEEYFASLGLKKDTDYTEPTLNHFQAKPGARFNYQRSLNAEIVWRMLQTRTSFKASGFKVENLERNVDARITTVVNARNVVWSFGQKSLHFTGSIAPKWGDPSQVQAFFDAINNADTKTECTLANKIVFETGNKFKVPWGQRDLDKIWVPGDWGYVTNKAFTASVWDPIYMGQNVIHLVQRQVNYDTSVT